MYSDTLLKVVGYYDLSVLSMSVMGFQKKKNLDGGWVGGVSSPKFFFWIFGIFLTLQITGFVLVLENLESHAI